jgi:hypothetical protein
MIALLVEFKMGSGTSPQDVIASHCTVCCTACMTHQRQRQPALRGVRSALWPSAPRACACIPHGSQPRPPLCGASHATRLCDLQVAAWCHEAVVPDACGTVQRSSRIPNTLLQVHSGGKRPAAARKGRANSLVQPRQRGTEVGISEWRCCCQQRLCLCLCHRRRDTLHLRIHSL